MTTDPMRHPHPKSLPWLSTGVPVLCLGLTTVTTTVLTPALVGLYVDSFGLSVGVAGYTAAIYLLGAGAGGFLVGSLALKVRTRTLLVLGLGLLSAGNFLSIVTAPFWVILAIRLMAGIGEGIGFGLMGSFISRMSNPGRVFGVFTIVMQLFGALVLWSLPWVRHEFGPRMILLPIAIAPLCLFLILGRFPDLIPNSAVPRRNPGVAADQSAVRDAWLAPLATFVLYVAYGGVFAYAERLAVYAGIGVDSAARLLAISSLLALGGAALATRLAGARGIQWKVCCAVAGVVCAIWLLVSGTAELYIAGLLAAFFFWSFFVPNLMTVSFLLDRNGRLGAATLGAMQWGMAAGPAITASYIGAKNLAVIGPIATAGFVAGLLMLLPLIRKVASGTQLATQPVA